MAVPILVVSCDAYRDVWHPFFHYFFHYWPDCQHPIYLVSNTIKYHDSRVRSLLVGQDIDYSTNLINALHKIPDEWMIFWIDDRPPSSPIDSQRIAELIELAQVKQASYLKLISSYPLAFVEEHEGIGELERDGKYLVSMTVALWKKSALLNILQSGESAWDIEKQGGKLRARMSQEKFFALPIDTRKKPPISDLHLIAKGRVRWQALSALQSTNLKHHLQERKPVSLKMYLYDQGYHWFWNIYYQIRWQIIRFFRRIQAT